MLNGFITYSDIKGEGFSESDSLKSISSKTSMIRADTGELNGSAVIDYFISNPLVLTGNITVRDLYILDGASITGAFSITVMRNCYIYSSSIDITSLDIKGNMTAKRKVGDESSTIPITLEDLSVLGDCNLENVEADIQTAHIGNFSIKDTAYAQPDTTYDLFVSGDMTVETSTFDYIANWNIGGTLTLDASPETSINISCKDFVFTGTELIALKDITNGLDGNPGDDLTGSVSTPPGGLGGVGARLQIQIAGTFTADNLTNIKALAGDGQPGQVGDCSNPTQAYSSGAGAGGSVEINLIADNYTFANTVAIILKAGDGDKGGACVGTNNDGGSGNGGCIKATATTSFSQGYYGVQGGKAKDSVLVNINLGTSNSQNHLTPTLTPGVKGIKNDDASDAFDGTVGTQTTNSTLSLDDILPAPPVLVTTDAIENPANLEFLSPDHLEDISFDFEIEVQQQFTEKIFQNVTVSDTNSNPEKFSGTPPYLQGDASTISFTLPTMDTGTYRWRVKTIKDADITKVSLFSAWRLFTVV